MTKNFRSSPARQQGLSFLGLLIVMIALALIGVLGAQAFPTYVEYQAIQKAVNKSKDGGTVAEVRAIFDRAAAIDDIKSISGKDLVVTKNGDKVLVKYAYTREIHMAGPAYLLLKYDGQSS